MSGKRRAAPSVTTTDIAGSKEIQGLFLNMIANQLARKSQQRSNQIAQHIRQETKPQILAAKWIGNYLFENGMTKTLSTVSAETGGVIKTIGLPYPIAEDFKFRGNKPFFRQLVSNLRPNLDKPRPLPKPASTTVVGTEVSTTAAQPTKSRDISGNRRRDGTETETKHRHHHHHSKRDSGKRHHHPHRQTETDTYESKRRHHRSGGHGRHHRRHEPTYSESYVSTSTYGAVKSREIPKTKPVNERPKVPGKLTFKERVQRLLMKSNLAVETSFEFEWQPGMDGSAYYPAGQNQVFQPPTAKSATSRTGIPSDQYYEEEDEEEDGYYYDASTHRSTRKTASTAKSPSSAKSGTTTSTHTSTAKSSSAAQPSSSTKKSSTKKSSTAKSDTSSSSSSSSSSGDEGASASDPEAEEDEEEDHKGEEEEEEEEDHGEEEDK